MYIKSYRVNDIFLDETCEHLHINKDSFGKVVGWYCDLPTDYAEIHLCNNDHTKCKKIIFGLDF